MNRKDSSEQESVSGRRIYRTVNKQYLINKINYVNFQDWSITARFYNKQYERVCSLEVRPSPCTGDEVFLRWVSEEDTQEAVESYEFKGLHLKDNGGLLVIHAQGIRMGTSGFSITLPETAQIVSGRKCTRYAASGITGFVVQDGSPFSGTLREFSPEAFSLELTAVPPVSFKWLNPQAPLHIILQKDAHIVYSGLGTLVRVQGNSRTRTCIIAPSQSPIRRYKAKEFRGQRTVISSPIHVSFVHPLSGIVTELKVHDISGSGFSVTENEDHASLLPGFIIPEMDIMLPGGAGLRCTVQVIHRRKKEKEGAKQQILCGISILDMDPMDHTRLLSFLHQESDSRSYICKNINLDALWNFFFESGFIYPEKYAHILAHKEEMKRIYRILYNDNPGIARYFLYQEDGVIYGHMSMLRSYENTWMLHHHASSSVESHNAGLHVLNQVGSFGNNCHRIQSMHMDYLLCYFRPENKFPMKVYGDIARKIDDPKSCSLDTFAYFHCSKTSPDTVFPDPSWSFERSTEPDILDLCSFYEKISGGLMMDAFDLKQTGSMKRIGSEKSTLAEEYGKLGLKREILLYSLKYRSCLKAVFMVDRSDEGLNMSDLTNCIKVFVTDHEGLTPSAIRSALRKASAFFEGDETPVLLFPASYAAEQAMPIEKTYILWVINMEESDKYFKHLKLMLRFAKH